MSHHYIDCDYLHFAEACWAQYLGTYDTVTAKHNMDNLDGNSVPSEESSPGSIISCRLMERSLYFARVAKASSTRTTARTGDTAQFAMELNDDGDWENMDDLSDGHGCTFLGTFPRC